jgi:hypothetical protein
MIETPVPPELVASVKIPKPKSPLAPLLFGVLLVFVLAAVAGAVYYKAKFMATPEISPTPTPTAIASSVPLPSEEPSATPAASTKAKASTKPISAIKPIASVSPSPTPITVPNLDLLFGNPSANIRQTFDDGSGAGRVINREFTSIQAGQFDELSSSWSPKVTVCFHIVSNETVEGAKIKFTYQLDNSTAENGTLSQYDKLEAGRLYDLCRDTTNDIGGHTAKLTINGDKSLTESFYANDSARVDWTNLADNVAPNFTIMGPNQQNEGTCLFPQYVTDNVTPYSSLKIVQKLDDQAWTNFDGNRFCTTGVSGSTHTYTVKVTDARGNANTQTKTFQLF